MRAWRSAQRLKTDGVAHVPKEIEVCVERLCTILGVRRAVACLQSTRISVPATVGWLKPVILLPTSTLLGLEMPQLEAILAHELAYIRRHDYLVNLL